MLQSETISDCGYAYDGDPDSLREEGSVEETALVITVPHIWNNLEQVY
jgi:hypothetical protein